MPRSAAGTFDWPPLCRPPSRGQGATSWPARDTPPVPHHSVSSFTRSGCHFMACPQYAAPTSLHHTTPHHLSRCCTQNEHQTPAITPPHTTHPNPTSSPYPAHPSHDPAPPTLPHSRNLTRTFPLHHVAHSPSLLHPLHPSTPATKTRPHAS